MAALAPAEADGACADAASAAAAAVEALYAGLPGGYETDKALALYNDSLTYGEMATADLALLCSRVRCRAARRRRRRPRR